MASLMSNPPGQVTLISQGQGVYTVQALKCTPLVPPLLIYYWYQGICWKLNTVWHCKSYLGKEQRRGDTAEHFFPHFSHFSSPIPHFPHFFLLFSLFFTFSCFSHFLSLIVTLFLKESWDLPSLTVNVWYIPWSRRYLITIFAEHCVKIHDSWYFQGILDNVINFDIDIIVSVTFFNESVDKKRHFNNISIPLSERIKVIKTSLERDISLTNLYPFRSVSWLSKHLFNRTFH